MDRSHPKLVRRRIMEILYESYQKDPLQMLSPHDIADHGTVVLQDLPPNCHYLHDRSFIELMMGYNPPMFDAARIAPQGIEIYENILEFDRVFPRDPSETRLQAPNVIPLIMQVAREAELSSLEGVRREWLLRDLDWLEGIIDTEQGEELPSLEKLKTMLYGWLT